MTTEQPGDLDLITVCDKCYQASCWQAIFMCPESQHAGIVKIERRKLVSRNLEQPSYLKTDKQLENERVKR